MKNKFLTLAFGVATLVGLAGCSESKPQTAATDYCSYVNPMIGTDGIVHTFPGAAYPFGMIQLSPDTDPSGARNWNWTSGYHYTDTNIKGFSHSHLSGTGWSGLGDILLMPTVGEIQLAEGSKEDPDTGYRSRISHDKESASPGYYQIELLDYDVNAELTVTPRAGIHRYTFPATDSANVIIDPASKIFEIVLDTKVQIVGDNTIEGFCHSNGWGGNRYIYFTAQFSKPFTTSGVGLDNKVLAGKTEAEGKDAKAFVTFATKKGEQIEVKFSMSAVSQEGARANLAAETTGKSFDQALAEARGAWEKELSKIEFTTQNEDQKKILYTGLYHALTQPNISMDVDGQYVAIDKNLKADGFTNYSTFSLWDTHRAVHPLMTIIGQGPTVDFVRSLVSRYENGGQLPMWELCGYDNTCMLGYPAVSVIGDAILKDMKGFDYEKAYEAMRAIAFFPKESSSDGPSGLEDYIAMGYIPCDVPKSVAKTLEYSYYDWCIAKVAEKLGKKEDAEMFYKRSHNFMANYNAERKLFWPKKRDGKWLEQMSMTTWDELQNHYVSGNIWAYNYFYPHATNMVIEAMGGREAFVKEMDTLFAIPLQMEGEQHVDISGFIGHYGHGDEPGHQIIYLYTYAGEPWKAAERIHEVANTQYFNSPNGMPNNDDCGQMSAWYIFSTMGFYPVCPGDLTYVIGSPMIEKAVIHTDAGTDFTMIAENLSASNIYIQSVTLNDKPLENGYIHHNDIMSGSTLKFVMGDKPNKEWMKNAPVSDQK